MYNLHAHILFDFAQICDLDLAWHNVVAHTWVYVGLDGGWVRAETGWGWGHVTRLHSATTRALLFFLNFSVTSTKKLGTKKLDTKRSINREETKSYFYSKVTNDSAYTLVTKVIIFLYDATYDISLHS